MYEPLLDFDTLHDRFISDGGYTQGAHFRSLLLSIAPRVARCTQQVDKTNATLVDGIVLYNVRSGRYSIEAYLNIAASASGGHKVALQNSGGSALALNSIFYDIVSTDLTNKAIVVGARATALGTIGNQVGALAVATTIRGHIDVSTAGDLSVQFAQSTTNGTASSLKVGSWLRLTPIVDLPA